MQTLSRRTFLRSSSLAIAGLACSGRTLAMKKNSPLLSFSTLGCPKWPLPDILNFAAGNGYQGIEIRGIMGEVDLTKCPDFSSTNIAATKRMVKDKQVRIVNLGSSAELHHPDGEKRTNSLDGAKRFIEIARQLECPYVRVFPNRFPPDQDRTATIDLISKGLLELAEFAKGSHVTVLLETHGDVVYTKDLVQIMKNTENPQVGLIWDFFNMWSVTNEAPALVYENLKKYIRHLHVKDAQRTNGEMRYVLLGEGIGPVSEVVQLLVRGGYTGFYSLEWEKLWHPEIAEPEVAFAQYPGQMKKYFKA